MIQKIKTIDKEYMNCIIRILKKVRRPSSTRIVWDDNTQAIAAAKKGYSKQLRHLSRTHPVSLGVLHELTEDDRTMARGWKYHTCHPQSRREMCLRKPPSSSAHSSQRHYWHGGLSKLEVPPRGG